MGSQLTLVGFSAGGTCTGPASNLNNKGRSWHSLKSAIARVANTVKAFSTHLNLPSAAQHAACGSCCERP